MNAEIAAKVLDRAKTIDFDEVCTRVNEIAATEKTEVVTAISQKRVIRVEGFTEFGFNALGKIIGFPAPFVLEVAKTNELLALNIIKDRVGNYFAKGKKPFYIRDFLGKTAGVVSQRYAYFDDKQVVDIISGSPLADMPFRDAVITPERFHLRAIDKDSLFKVDGDNSPLFFAYFIDNSMVGQSSFKVQMGVYRVACTNGLILPAKGFSEYTVCRQIHLGKRDIAAEFNEGVAFLTEKKETLRDLLCKTANEKAKIEDVREDFRSAYLQKQLNVSQKEAETILTLYSTTYEGGTRWKMINAITEFARDVNDVNRRESIERAAFKAA